MPEGPPLYPEGQLTDEPEETLIAEVIREAALEGVRDELPHSIAVTIDEVIPGKTVKVHASVFVERDSQKGIVIGHKGARLREIGSASRTQIERILGSPVFLDLHVKVAKDWQRDPKQLRKLGSENSLGTSLKACLHSLGETRSPWHRRSPARLRAVVRPALHSG